MISNVLVACEESQAVCKEFRKLGHNAFSNDLQDPSGGYPEWHIKDDCLKIINLIKWDLVIGHPPCDFLSGAGNRWFNEDLYGVNAILRKQKRQIAVDFFMQLYNCNCEFICIENPVGFINHLIKPTQVIHPYFFNDPEMKKTCLWLKNLPKLIHIKNDDLFNKKTHTTPTVHYVSRSGRKIYITDAITGSGKDSRKLRSKTFPGIAKAMAVQWSEYIINKKRQRLKPPALTNDRI
jgi:site-specific DNA-cytosine methylase